MSAGGILGRRDRADLRRGSRVIGSLFAAHLSRVADVWVLTRRGGTRALAADGLTVTGRAEFTSAVHATTRPSCPRSTSRSSRPRRPGSTLRRARSRDVSQGTIVVTVQNGLGAEQVVRGHGDWPLVSGSPS